MTYRYEWSSSNKFGFVKESTLINHNEIAVDINILDGIQNILPYGVGSDLQNQSSNLVDAYKRNELIENSGLGIYALSAIIVDKAEPSEALKANTVWSSGLDDVTYLLSSLQLKTFRKGKSIIPEFDVKAEKGAYFINSTLTLSSNESKQWMIVANVNQNHSQIVKLSKSIVTDSNLCEKVRYDVKVGTERLITLNSSADGVQLSGDKFRDSRHFSNTLFNIMRGGILIKIIKLKKMISNNI